MADLERLLSAAREAAEPAWDREREEAVRAGLARRQARRATRRRALGAAAAGLLLAAAVILGVRFHDARSASPPSHVAQVAELLRLDDGSTVTAAAPGAEATPIEVGPKSVTVRLGSGAARFSVTPNPERAFRVQAGDVTVTVVGTVFTVALEPRGVRVRVERGRVRVAWPLSEHLVSAGEELFVDESVKARAAEAPPEPAPEALPGAAEPELGASPAPAPQMRSAAPAPRTWRALAQDGEYASAYARMSAQGPSSVRDDPGDLLLAADVARLGGHPEKAVPLLERVVSTHSSDSRAPLSAFTLGRTLLDQLGRPREAAAAFAQVRRLDPGGALAQDALAREVESWSRAGEQSLARERAEEYVTRYPRGRRLEAVRHLGGLE